ncbi:MAG: glycosyltransferase family 39 protein, partial [Chloroflexi bacterium]|nr:glycosyltransferase family 39 protein [Chloroflexota bacterium]
MDTPISKRQKLALVTGIFLLLWAVYLLVYSGTLLVIDEQHIFAVAESVALHGTVDANQVRFAPHILPASGKFGLNGDYHTTHGSAISFLAAPMVLLARMLPHVGAVQASLLLNPLFTALTAVLVFCYVQRLFGSWRTGLVTALIFGLCTLALPYAKTLYIEPLSALTLFGAAWALLLYRDRGDLRSLALGGGLIGLAVMTKPTNGVALPAFLLYAIWVFLRNRARVGRPIPREAVLAALAFGLPLAAFLAGLGVFNAVRFGDPLDVGHVAYSLQFNTP